MRATTSRWAQCVLHQTSLLTTLLSPTHQRLPVCPNSHDFPSPICSNDSSPANRLNRTLSHLFLPCTLPPTCSTPRLDLHGDNTSSSLLGPGHFRCLPSFQARIWRLYIQRYPSSTCRTFKGD